MAPSDQNQSHSTTTLASTDVPRIDYTPDSSLATDLKVLRYMWFAKIGGGSHQERLESFYKDQAELYDSYRYRMLHGRFPMIQAMPTPKAGVWVDMCCGTASNLEFFGDNLNHFSKVVALDLCPSLAKQAEERVKRHNWEGFVDVVVADACDENAVGLPPAGTVDVVTYSYALTMIPDWKKAIMNAHRLLKPGGHIAVCDFTVDESQYGFSSTFWKKVFSTDHVFLNEEHRPFLRSQFEPAHEEMGFGAFPYVPPMLKCPWYVFVGKKK